MVWYTHPLIPPRRKSTSDLDRKQTPSKMTFLDILDYLKQLSYTTIIYNKIKLLWGHNPLNWLRFQWQLKSVQNGNNIIIVVAVVAVVVVRFFLFNCCGNYFSNIMDHKFFWSKNKFYPKKNLAQKWCWYNKMLGQKLRLKKSCGPQKFWLQKNFTQKVS